MVESPTLRVAQPPDEAPARNILWNFQMQVREDFRRNGHKLWRRGGGQNVGEKWRTGFTSSAGSGANKDGGGSVDGSRGGGSTYLHARQHPSPPPNPVSARSSSIASSAVLGKPSRTHPSTARPDAARALTAATIAPTAMGGTTFSSQEREEGERGGTVAPALDASAAARPISNLNLAASGASSGGGPFSAALIDGKGLFKTTEPDGFFKSIGRGNNGQIKLRR